MTDGMTLPRLLLVDDHKLLRQGLRRAVEEAGFDVVGEASDGEEAVRLASALQPDVVLMDVSMPVLDGIAATLHAVAAGDTDLSADLARSMLAELPGPDQVSADPPVSVLSQREAEVLQLFADGCSTVEVGQRLYISAKTVKNHLASIYEKLDARDRTQAVLTAVRMGIIRLN